MSANGKKWSQYNLITDLASGDEILTRDISAAAADQVTRMTRANAASALGVFDVGLSGARRNGIRCNGTSTSVSFTDHASLDFGTGDFSIGGLAYFASNPVATQYIYAKRNNGAGVYIGIDSSGVLQAHIEDGSGSSFSSGGHSLAGRLFHWLVTFDRSGNMVRYINGVPYGNTTSISTTSLSISNSEIAYLARSTNATPGWFAGNILGLLATSDVITATEAAQLAANGNNPDAVGLDNVVIDLDGVVGSRFVDRTTNKIDGTIANGSEIYIPASRFIHSPSDGATDVVEQITAGAGATSIHKRYGDGHTEQDGKIHHVASNYGYQEDRKTTIADDAAAALDTIFTEHTVLRGIIMFRQKNSSGQGTAILMIDWTNNAPTILGDISTSWSTTKDTASKLNIYLDAGNSYKPTIQNKLGFDAEITMSAFFHFKS